MRLLDENLKYIKHEIHDDKIFLYAKSKRKQPDCPYCGKTSKNVQSRVKRTLQDLPIQGMKDY
jgi:glutaredoxin-related protein